MYLAGHEAVQVPKLVLILFRTFRNFFRSDSMKGFQRATGSTGLTGPTLDSQLRFKEFALLNRIVSLSHDEIIKNG